MTTPWKCWRDPRHDQISETIFGWPQCGICRAAPAYHERPKYLRDDFALGIYVPLEPFASTIHPHSGLVGLPNGGDDEDARVHVYYEGWVNGAMQYEDRDARGKWEAGIEHAASRMVCDYPTVAQATPRTSMLQLIGLYFPKSRQIEVDDEDALRAWLA